MIFSRRNFLVTALGSLATAAMGTSPVVAQMAAIAPPEDKLARVARLTRTVDAEWKALLCAGSSKPSRALIESNEEFMTASRSLLGLINSDFGLPKAFDCDLLMELNTDQAFWEFDIFDEQSLAGLSHEMVGVAVVRGLLYHRRVLGIPVNSPEFTQFSEKYRDVIMREKQSEDEIQFVRRFSDVRKRGYDDLAQTMRESYMEYRETGRGLYVPRFDEFAQRA